MIVLRVDKKLKQVVECCECHRCRKRFHVFYSRHVFYVFLRFCCYNVFILTSAQQ